MTSSDYETFRKVSFKIEDAEGDGVQFLIGRASLKDPERFDRENNFLFHEKSLSKKHAMLCIKRLFPADQDPYVPLLDQFRISVQDLGSTHGLVDLQSQDADAKVIDLKNGERFGLIKLYQPVAAGQSRGAKLKFQISLKSNEFRPDAESLDLVLNNVTYEDSPFTSRPSTTRRTEDEDLSSSCSSSDLNFSEDLDLHLDTYERGSFTPKDDTFEKQESSLKTSTGEDGTTFERPLDVQVLLEDDDDGVSSCGSVQDEIDEDIVELVEENEGPTSSSDLVITITDQSPAKRVPTAEVSISRDVTPQCYDCATAVEVQEEDECELSSINDDVFDKQIRKRGYEEQEDEDEIVSINEVKRSKTTPIPDTAPGVIKADTRQVFIGGMIGFLAGSVGTLGLLVGIANMG
ncbi:uncharacterized protein LALA0_S05e05556g [Lachancea lanzarotensis]|uniref:LALA0S05e05556g1_1 n=1 Tax=Lachancea lanzarotensis TaxID=1245769 RepID=A0A0C7MR76_9SACH|nr:uncharacterized protein LALA0_S05e05556g [Lachancea lanzarotensis]CEP62433.1 LALA0S05e05556g1_1 [Lachancea lanzarotensis]